MPWIEPDFIIQAKCDTCGHADEFGWDDRHEKNYPGDPGWGGAYDRESWLAFVDSVPPEADEGGPQAHPRAPRRCSVPEVLGEDARWVD